MPKPNYSFEKRKRELDKVRKKKDKEAEKAARKNAPDGPPQDDAAQDDAAQIDPSQPIPEPPKE